LSQYVESEHEATTPLPVRVVAGIPVAVSTPHAAARWLCEVASSSPARPVDVHLVNAYSIAQTEQDEVYRQALSDAELNLPDGKPLAWFTRMTRTPLIQVRGPGLFNAVMDVGREYGLSHFLLGTTDDTLTLLQIELEARYPGVQIAGTYSPPFRPLTDAERCTQDERIRTSEADITWVGLGTPKQDFEAQRLARSLPGVVVAVGAAFDFVAGTKREAPAWMRNAGLEWVFRLASEPRRLWRRYLVGNTIFVRKLLLRRSSA